MIYLWNWLEIINLAENDDRFQYFLIPSYYVQYYYDIKGDETIDINDDEDLKESFESCDIPSSYLDEFEVNWTLI